MHEKMQRGVMQLRIVQRRAACVLAAAQHEGLASIDDISMA